MDFNSVNNILSSKLNEAYASNKNVEKATAHSSKKIQNDAIIATIGSAYNNMDTKKDTPFDKKQLAKLEEVVKGINEEIKETKSHISYDVHEATNTILVKLVDSDTDEIIREYPSVKNLDFVARIMEKVGLMFDAKK